MRIKKRFRQRMDSRKRVLAIKARFYEILAAVRMRGEEQ